MVLTSSSSFLQGIVQQACLCSYFVRRLVDFFATWCQPCKMMHPILEQVKAVQGDRIHIIKVDVDKYGVTANQPMEQREQKSNLFGLCRVSTEEDDSQYGIQSVPTLMLFRQGDVLWRTSGVMQKSELLATIDTFLRQKSRNVKI